MYFKTIPLPFDLNQSQAEAYLRKASIKESMSLDFKFRSIDIVFMHSCFFSRLTLL
jgi:hypothetical protein